MPKDKYKKGSGTPAGYRWITIHPTDKGLENQHILVADSGQIAQVKGESPKQKFLDRLVRGRHIGHVAPHTARHEGFSRHAPEPKTDPAKRRQIRIYEKEIRRIRSERIREKAQVRKMARIQWDEMHPGAASLADAVKKQGGVSGSPHFPLAEIPIIARRKKTAKPARQGFDEVLKSIRENGFYFDSDSKLYEAILAKPTMDTSRKLYIESELAHWEADDSSHFLEAAFRDGIKDLNRRRFKKGA